MLEALLQRHTLRSLDWLRVNQDANELGPGSASVLPFVQCASLDDDRSWFGDGAF